MVLQTLVSFRYFSLTISSSRVVTMTKMTNLNCLSLPIRQHIRLKKKLQTLNEELSFTYTNKTELNVQFNASSKTQVN